MEDQNQNNSYPGYDKLKKITVGPSADCRNLNKVADPRLLLKIENLQALLRELLQLPQDYHVLVLNSGNIEHQSIFSILNFSKNIWGGFLDTGSRSSEAIIAARKYFDVEIIGSSRESSYSYIPQCDWLPQNISFLHITSTNALQGNRVSKFPKVSLPLLCDRSADLFSAQISFDFFDLVYAHGGLGIIPEHLSLICIRDSLLAESSCSLFTEPLIINRINQAVEICFKDIFLFQHRLTEFKANGGVDGHVSRLCSLSVPLYREIERNSKFKAIVNPKDRSVHAVRFFVANPEDEFRFILQLGKENINIVDRVPRGDFLVDLTKYKQKEIFQLIDTMQCFE